MNGNKFVEALIRKEDRQLAKDIVLACAPEAPRSHDSEVWQRAIEAGKREPRDVLSFDPVAVRRALRDAREHRGRAVPHRVKSVLP